MTRNELLKHLQDNPGLASEFIEAAKSMETMLVYRFLLMDAYLPITSVKSEELAYKAAHAEGYMRCLTNIINFQSVYLTPQERRPKENFEPSYGGFEIALERGFITKEQYDQLKKGE